MNDGIFLITREIMVNDARIENWHNAISRTEKENQQKTATKKQIRAGNEWIARWNTFIREAEVTNAKLKRQIEVLEKMEVA